MKRPRVLVDVDGVLADFVTPALQVAREITKHPLPLEIFNEWDMFEHPLIAPVVDQCWEVYKRPGFAFEMEPLPGAKEGMAALHEVADVYIVTTPVWSPHWVTDRNKWLKKHFGISNKKVVYTSAKYLCVGDLLVDDKPDNVLKWAAAHETGKAVLWSTHFTRNEKVEHPRIVRTDDWTRVVELIKTGS